ncbi:putative tricarboxylic transport membrane protein [Salsuginibacillus halophilus]|uniref:Putative tricarboxylic transport membrane protein n=1 Tax=Salsuginibacillus halophilus TaxID=517424 RepID=A0A2P8H9A1_9BACI|nr:tripartite tricarboxylate transporter permease [Salsuginibacillus halophilus]PSL42771.1 putative tricarboxylic transport membrane protein [Salsuginibacillus halophilus]
MFDLLYLGIAEIFQPQVLLIILLGVIAGIITGLIPGFTVAMAIVLTLPLTFGLDPVSGVAAMIGVLVGGMSGGLITASLLGIPGTPSAVATTFDGFPMARNGQPGKALSIGIWASFLSSIVSLFLLVAIAPQIASFALMFGPWEMFALIVAALTIIASVTGESVLKGLIAGMFGLLIATVGADPISGISRFSFDFATLRAGIPFLVVLIGMFAVSRLMESIQTSELEKDQQRRLEDKAKDVQFVLRPIATLKQVMRKPVNLLRSSSIGAIVGAIPGAGGSIANIIAYDQAKKWSKTPDEFGKGHDEGVVASEAGNNSTVGGDLIPTVALGIPGSAVTAVLLSALMVHGINPGPLLITNEPNIVGGIFVAFLAASFFMLVVQFTGIKYFIRVTEIPAHVLVPVILVLCVLGTFVLNNRVTDLYILLLMGIVGYIFVKYKFTLAPVIIGVILGPIAETNLRRAYMNEPEWTLFFTRPISLTFLIIAVLSIVFTIWQARRAKAKAAAQP